MPNILHMSVPEVLIDKFPYRNTSIDLISEVPIEGKDIITGRRIQLFRIHRDVVLTSQYTKQSDKNILILETLKDMCNDMIVDIKRFQEYGIPSEQLPSLHDASKEE